MSAKIVEWRCPNCRGRGTADSPGNVVASHNAKQPNCRAMPTIIGATAQAIQSIGSFEAVRQATIIPKED